MNLLKIIYPPMCSICGTPSECYLCKKCEKKLKQIEIISCIENKSSEDIFFDERIHGFMYEGIIRNLILQYKFGHKPYIYKTFKTFFEKSEKLYVLLKKYDIIVPVPISKKRCKNRGYNQSTLLAKDLSTVFNLQLEDKVLIKVKNNPRQSTLNQEERLINTKGVYKTIQNGKIVNKSIILFDDVFTTGATCNECAKILKEAGAKRVGVFTITKD